VGTPHPTSDQWTAAADGVGSLGGNAHLFNAISGNSGYALVGCAACGAGQPEANQANYSQLSGYLTRGYDSTLEASLADPAGSVGFSLQALAYQSASHWPVPTDDGQANALAWVSQQLGIGNPNATSIGGYCYRPAAWDLRAEYCNTNIDWALQATRLKDLTLPPGAHFDAADLAAVQKELIAEFTWVSQVRNLVDNLEKVFASSESASGFDLAKVTNDVLNASGANGSSEVAMSALELMGSFIVGAGAVAELEVEPAVGLIVAGIKLASAVSEQPDGTETLGEVRTKAADLGAELAVRYAAAQDNLGLAFNLLVTDYTKLLTANLQVVGGAWQLGYPLSSDLTKALNFGTKQLTWTELLPVSKYNTQWRISVPPGKTPANLVCYQDVGNNPGAPYHPFSGAPAGAHVQMVTGFDASGRVNKTQDWFIGQSTSTSLIYPKFPPSSLVDPLFQALPGGLGMSPVRFYSQAAFAVTDYSGGIPKKYTCNW
jgi:hypothetical protein